MATNRATEKTGNTNETNGSETANNLQENLKKYFYSGVGLAAHTAEVVQKSIQELVDKGKVHEADGKKIVQNAMKKVEERRPEIEAKYNAAVHKFLKATSTEMGKLQKRIDQLEEELRTRKETATAKSTKASAKKAQEETED